MDATRDRPSHERLEAWQKGKDLVVGCYQIAQRLPDVERFGLASQLRRAAVSVPTNIAEGCSREGPRDRLRFLAIARASLSEVRTLLLITVDLDYVTSDDLESLLNLHAQVARLVAGLRRRLIRLSTTH